MTYDSKCLVNFVAKHNAPLIQLGDNSTISAIGNGVHHLHTGGDQTIRLEDVLAVPKLGTNLFSPGQAAEAGLKFLIDGDFMTIYNEAAFRQPAGDVLAKIRKIPDNLYRLDANVHMPAIVHFARRHHIHLPMSLWHSRLGHTCYHDVIHLSEKVAQPIKLDDKQARESTCEPCIMGEMTRGTFSPSGHNPSNYGDLIVSGSMEPFSTPGIDRSR